MTSRGIKKYRRSSSFECEYLVGDDSCRAVKEGDMGALRAEACYNEFKDACCYSCGTQRECDIGCDLFRRRKAISRPKTEQLTKTITMNLRTKPECGNCIHYLKPTCSRGYSKDADLWKRQDPCEIFEVAEEGKH